MILLALGTLSACTKVVTKEVSSSDDHYTKQTSAASVHEVQDGNVKMSFISKSAFNQMVKDGAIKSASDKAAQALFEFAPTAPKASKMVAANDEATDDSILLGYPIDLLGEASIFGGVITKISDKDNQDLGSLKLTDLPPIHVITAITNDGEGTYLTLVGCMDKCDESSKQEALMSFPIVGLDQDKNQLVVDLSTVGDSLNLMRMIDPTGKNTQLRSKSSETTTLDYSLTTLVFDVTTKMIPVKADPEDATAPVTTVVARWYLKLGSAFDPAFTPRSPVNEVGFFKTERAKDPKIMRHSFTNYGKKIHYYVKNVPAEYQNNVKVSFDNWNAEFKTIVGRDILSYEFIPAGDARNEKIVAGDIRYNVMEWDLENQATYGGLGPSMGNQFTGEIMSSNILLQGPRIVDMYSKWFKISEDARALVAEGRAAEAEAMLRKFATKIKEEQKKASEISYKVSVGSMEMTVHSQRPELEDDAVVPGLFEQIPAGYTFETYMPGYFQEMIQHEMGHNLGLRHNFRGNLGSNDSGEKGSVSRSIMEYLGRSYRYINAIGLYDRMAIAYGYTGAAPAHKNWFCTDEDQGLDAKSILVKSPECSKADATNDPFSFWEGRLNRAIEMMVNSKSNRAPAFPVDYISSEVSDLSAAYAGYALSAEKTASTWTNFFGVADRPDSVTDVKAYVVNSLTKRLCNPAIADIIASKESPEAIKATQDSYTGLVTAIQANLTKLGLLKDKEVICK